MKDYFAQLHFNFLNRSSWGNLMTGALSRAVEKAMEADVEYRRGLPVDLSSFMGTGIVSVN